MGQQFSDENYCMSTIKKLSNELTTTDSYISESQVVVNEGNNCKISFPWREWTRVSKYLERILPNEEQKRLLETVALDQTGIKHCELRDVWERITGLSDYDDVAQGSYSTYGYQHQSVNNGSTMKSNGTSQQPTLNLNPKCAWSVHLNYREHSDSNVILHRDFIKVHFRLNNVFTIYQHDSSSPHSASRDSGLSVSTPASSTESTASNSPAELGNHDSYAICRYQGDCHHPDQSIQSIICDTQELTTYIQVYVERLSDVVKKLCSKIAINVLVTNAQYHSRDNCIVISGTIDIRSILKNSGSVELRSRPNEEAEDQELSDHLQRSLNKIGGLKDKLINFQEEASAVAASINGASGSQQSVPSHSNPSSNPTFFYPMYLYYTEDSKRVTLIYGMEKQVIQQQPLAHSAVQQT